MTLEGEFRVTMYTKMWHTWNLTFGGIDQRIFREDVEWMSRVTSQRLTEQGRWIAPETKDNSRMYQGGNLFLREVFRRCWKWYYQLVRRWSR